MTLTKMILINIIYLKIVSKWCNVEWSIVALIEAI